MADIVTGSVAVEVVPSARQFWRRFRAETRAGADSMGDALGDVIGEAMAEAIVHHVVAGLRESWQRWAPHFGRLAGHAYGVEFGRWMLLRIRQAMAEIPHPTVDVNVDVDTLRARREIRALGDAADHPLGKINAVRLAGLAVKTVLVPAFASVAQGLVGIAVAAVGAAGVIPGVVFAAVASLQVLKLAVHGVGDAVKAGLAGDWEKFSESMDKLAPSAQQFVRAVVAMQPKLEDLRKSVQQRFFIGLAQDVNILARHYLPLLKNQLGIVASAWNRAIRGAAEMTMTTRVVNDINEALGHTGQAGTNLSKALLPLEGALVDIIVVGTKFLNGFTGGAQGAATQFERFIHGLRQSGNLEQFFARGVSVVGDLGKVLRNVGGILAGIFRAGREDGVGFLAQIEAMTRSWRDWVNSVAGQQQIGAILAALGDVARVMAQPIKDLIRAFAALAPFMSRIATAIAPLVARGFELIALGVEKVASWLMRIPISVLRDAAIVIGLVVVAVKAWIVVQAILNAELWANPIGLVVGLIGALIAAVIIAWQHSSKFRDVLISAWTGIRVAALWAWEQVLKPAFFGIKSWITDSVIPAAVRFHQILTAAWAGISGAAQRAWFGVILPVYQGIKLGVDSVIVPAFQLALLVAQTVWPTIAAWVQGSSVGITGALRMINTYISEVLAPIVLWLWHEVFEPAWKGISFALQVAWTIIQIIWGLIKVYILDVLAPIFVFLWKGVVQPAFTAIMVIIQVAWAIIQIIFGLMIIFIKVFLAPPFIWLWQTIIKPAFDGIAAAIAWAWSKISPILKALGDFIAEHVAPAFRKGVEAIGKAWDAVREKAAVPVRFVVKTILNEGIIKAYNALAKKFNVNQVDPIPINFATGGIYPGYSPGRDIGIAAVSGGEAIMRPEWTRAMGAGYVNAANAAARIGGVEGVKRFLAGGAPGTGANLAWAGAYADGGIVDWILHPIDTAKKVFGGALDRLGEISASPFGQLVANVPRNVYNDVTGFLKGLAKKIFGGGNVSTGMGWARQWEIVHGQFPSAQLFSALRPGSTAGNGYDWHHYGRAIDVTPSMDIANWLVDNFPNSLEIIHTPLGARQVKNGHFRTYGEPVASQHYDHVHWAYDKGGYLPPGLTMAYNGTGRPEAVLTDAQFEAMAQRGGDTFNLYQTRISPVDLEGAIARRDALARVGRPR